MLFKDHLNFIGENPIRGLDTWKMERFVDLSDVYDLNLAKQIRVAARKAKAKLYPWVYCAVCGTSYETPAEIRAYAKLGADAVGMSTVPEAIIARQHGIRVGAISCITNLASGISKLPLTHQEVLETGLQTAKISSKLLSEFARNYVRP